MIGIGACLLLAAGLHAAPPGPVQDSLVARGRRTFEAVCSACHSVQPPAKQAPPMANIARRYRVMTASRAELAERVAAWAPAPRRERSLMPPMALEHWQLMPALPLPAEDLRAVGHYVAYLAFDTVDVRPGMGHQGGRAHRDTTAARR